MVSCLQFKDPGSAREEQRDGKIAEYGPDADSEIFPFFNQWGVHGGIYPGASEASGGGKQAGSLVLGRAGTWVGALSRHSGRRQRQRSTNHTACDNIPNVPSVFHAGRQESRIPLHLLPSPMRTGGRIEGPIQLSVRQPGQYRAAIERPRPQPRLAHVA